MAKINPAQLQALLASMGVEVVGTGSADAKVATTAKARPVNNVPYTLAKGNYKGHPTVTFSRDGSRPVVMGHGKIKLVLAHADALRKIVG